MNTLISIASWVTAELQEWPVVERLQSTDTDSFSDEQFTLKVRAELRSPFQLQIRLYYNHGHLDYSYQLFTDAPIMRWDNKEDWPEIPTAPHHFHDENDRVLESPLNGDLEHDLPLVREAIEKFLGDEPPHRNPKVRTIR